MILGLFMSRLYSKQTGCGSSVDSEGAGDVNGTEVDLGMKISLRLFILSADSRRAVVS